MKHRQQLIILMSSMAYTAFAFLSPLFSQSAGDTPLGQN